MARDAMSAGDRIASETYYQHAEHYFRILNSSTDPQPNGQGRSDRRGGDNRSVAAQDSGRQDGQPLSESQGDQAFAPVGNGQDAPLEAQPRPQGHGGRHRRPAPPLDVAPRNGGQADVGNAEPQPNPRPESDCDPASV